MSESTVHIVQVSRDRDLLARSIGDEPMQRQRVYMRLLNERVPRARMTILVMGAPAGLQTRIDGNLTISPIRGSNVNSVFALDKVLTELHRRARIDVLTTQTIFDEGVVAARFSRRHSIPIVGQIHWDLCSPNARASQLGTSLLGKLRWHLGMQALPHFHTVRAVGSNVVRHLQEQRQGCRAAWIPVPNMSLQSAAGCVLSDTREPRVLFVGRLAPEKKVDDWLSVAAEVRRKVPGAHFDIVGDGPCRADLEKKVMSDSLSDCVTFHGWRGGDDLARHYATASVLLLTSEHEGFGRVLVEAAQFGTPAVAPAVGGIRDIVRNGSTGFAYEPGDLLTAANRTAELLASASERAQFGAAARRYVAAEFDPDVLARRWINLLVQACVPTDDRAQGVAPLGSVGTGMK